MRIDINAMSEKLARDSRINDYDFWRTLKNLNNEIFEAANDSRPIPIEMIRWRAIVKAASARRQDL